MDDQQIQTVKLEVIIIVQLKSEQMSILFLSSFPNVSNIYYHVRTCSSAKGFKARSSYRTRKNCRTPCTA